ncbi:MAG: hypothetical protein C4555_01835 [Dehalococcoidia bacterium]|nr:MAG: hypothetical protein C4555_01835 [Dehalococcoidia bacterium]
MLNKPTPLTIEHISPQLLVPSPDNPRTISASQLAALERSITQFGLVDPIVVRQQDRTVIGGHQRLAAAKRLGLTTVPVVYVEREASLLNLALNRISGDWDLEKLGEILTELRELPEIDVSLSGFEEIEIDRLLADLERHSLELEEENFDVAGAMAQAQQLTAGTRVQPGQLWQLGKHRLLCGDATVEDNWQRLMGGKQAQAVITDPPYAVHYVGGRAAQEERIAKARRGVDQPSDTYWDDLTPEAYRQLLLNSLSLSHSHTDAKAPLYLWFGTSHIRDVLQCLLETGWQERNLLVWVKNNGAGALFAQYKHWYEPCFYAHKQNQAPRWHGPTNESTVWQHDKPLRNELHPTMKPLALIERAIRNASSPGQTVVDPFLGSGTALIAAERTGRVCFGFDLEVRYCDVILARWEELAGEQARLVEGGQ